MRFSNSETFSVLSGSGDGIADGVCAAGMAVLVAAVDPVDQIDEILELIESQLTSAEVFTALFELEIAGRVRQLPGKNYVRVL